LTNSLIVIYSIVSLGVVAVVERYEEPAANNVRAINEPGNEYRPYDGNYVEHEYEEDFDTFTDAEVLGERGDVQV